MIMRCAVLLRRCGHRIERLSFIYQIAQSASSGGVMANLRAFIPRLDRLVSRYELAPPQTPTSCLRWTVFMAGLWLRHIVQPVRIMLRRRTRGAAPVAALVSAFVILPSCSELAQPSGVPSGPEPPYVALVAKHLQSAFKDRSAFEGFEISGVRWVHTIKGWTWLSCVHFTDHSHRRSYAVFIQGDAVVEARYAVETDACESQTYTQFDVTSGVLGRPTAPEQPPLY
jgi:hypothetical protein